ncbi:MAG: glucoamylase family protein [Clostridium sp.]|uniref:GH36-type glycosyl hydrolase domain-containing protein n=1 Tax=Clostridium sp. TaxID=1506 RepID=UPI0030620CD7
MDQLFILVNLVLILSIVFFMFSIKNRNKNAIIKLEDMEFLEGNRENVKDIIQGIARDHKEIRKSKNKENIISSLDKYYDDIIYCHNSFKSDGKDAYNKAKGVQWILDNIYVVEKEYKNIKKCMPKKYLRALPVLKSGALKGYPRIYALARELLKLYQESISEENINGFLCIYQEVTALTMGELWALPLMIKVAYIEVICKSCLSILNKGKAKFNGEKLAARIIIYYNNNNMDEAMDFLKENHIEFEEYFADAFVKIMKDNGVDHEGLNLWVQSKLFENEINLDKLFMNSHKTDAIYSASISNSINGIRNLENINWRSVFEINSKVEEILNNDPLGIYKGMDFHSKDYYRHTLERIAKENNFSETFLARKVIQCTQGEKTYDFESHVGYYLVDRGRDKLNASLNIDFKGFDKFKNILKGRAVGIYIATMILATLLLVSIFVIWSYFNDTDISILKYILAVIVTIIPLSEVTISILNWSITHLSIPNLLPKIDLSRGIPMEALTCVVIPVIVENTDRAEVLISNIEKYYLSNKDENLYFALLCDFKDSNNEVEESDVDILNFCIDRIELLNKKYGEIEARFFFLARSRKFNHQENRWIGWERKRGKLEEFNRLIKGDKNTTYNVFSSDIKTLKEVKYIITLDGDTVLPRDTARVLVGTMVHPLNKAYIKEDCTIWRGYGIMQPRISIDLESANKTYFSKVFSGEVGIDMYTTAVSDVYQDLFGEGIFTGKAIYNVDVFNKVVKDKIKENTVLSHDLLEGSLGRTALLTDVELIDGYPSNFVSSSKRLHRWVRGDWQLLPYIFEKNNINRLSKWKMIDNLRRSLLAPSMVILLISSLLGILPDGINKWYMAAFIAIVTPILFDISENAVKPMSNISLSGKIQNFEMVLRQVYFIYTFLPFKAYLMVDAIVRTLYRLVISKKDLLQWQTSDEVEKSSGKTILSYWKYMWMGPVISIIILTISAFNGIQTLYVIIPSCIIWIISPLIAYIIGNPIDNQGVKLNPSEINVLRGLSRKTWAYFEDFVSEETNYLGGDNYQEEPYRGLAMRTSPTNIGMTLISNVVAVDMGYIGMKKALENLEKTIATLDKLETYKGHFYNWYDVTTLKPLAPRYVSTVDSGNLISYLYTINEALKEFVETPYYNNRISGIEDTINLAMDEFNNDRKKYMYLSIVERIKGEVSNVMDFYNILDSFKEIIGETIEVIEKEKCESDMKTVDYNYWNKKLLNNVNDYINEIEFIFPFISKLKGLPNDLSREMVGIISGKSLNDLVQMDEDFNLNLEALDESQESILCTDIRKSKDNIQVLLETANFIIIKLNSIIERTDFECLYSNERNLFHIGYDVDNEAISNNYYDLLASEARTTSFLAIARGTVPLSHWFSLSRSLISMDGNKGLVSWSGTMFEYFMPRLLMKNFRNSLLDETYRAVIGAQMKYGKKKLVPFGISESAYFKFDIDLNYQYKAFGTPKVGLKRGLEEELVISPYSTLMALMENIPKSMENIIKLKNLKMEGKYGFYEAIDYTKKRIKHKEFEIVKCYMIHHLGMSFLALDNVINKNIIQERFHRIPMVKATELLLQEKTSKNVVYDRKEESKGECKELDIEYLAKKTILTGCSKYPESLFLGNKSYNLLIENGGGGYSKADNLMVYRWREDLLRRDLGMFFYIKDLDENKYTSSTYEPCKDNGSKYEANFYLYKGEFVKHWNNLEVVTEVHIVPEEKCEIRKVIIKNKSQRDKIIEVTSYCEVVLQHYDGDLAHPAFGNLFVTTEYIDSINGVMAKRRVRSEKDKEHFLIQTSFCEGEILGESQYETARINFIGRNHSKANPVALEKNENLGNFVGNVLDPILSIRNKVKIKQGDTISLTYVTVTGSSRDEVLTVAVNYQDSIRVKESLEKEALRTEEYLSAKGIKPAQVNIYEKVASSLIFLNNSYTKREGKIKNIIRCQKNLWTYGISGDLPIFLITIEDEKYSDILRQVIDCHSYLSDKGVDFDIVVLNKEEVSYEKPTDNAIREIILNSDLNYRENMSGGIFVLNALNLTLEDINLLKAIASIEVDGKCGSLWEQIDKVMDNKYFNENCTKVDVDKKSTKYGKNKASKLKENIPTLKNNELVKSLEFFNSYGGFNKNGEYTIALNNSETTPTPWINVISNGNFGFNISESGSSYTWYKNSREFKITPWNNDYVEDTLNEALYLQDEGNKSVWSITPKPIRGMGEYLITHGFGYSKFTHESNGILGQVTMFVPQENNVKILKIKLKNLKEKSRKLSATYLARLCLGSSREHTHKKIYTEINKELKYIYGRNSYSCEFSSNYAYLKIFGGENESFSGDGSEFLECEKRIGNLQTINKLSNIYGEGLEPILSEQVSFNIGPLEEKEIFITLGVEESIGEVEKILSKLNHIEAVEEELKNVKAYWSNLLGTVKVTTEDKSLDLMVNGWLPYETISCRLFSRTAFYQCGGAYGFRDQLQDSIPMIYLKPEITRNQILYSASRQFEEGDVQHWWHPVVDSGIRTRFSDDLLWLPYVTSIYVKATGDYGILDELVEYLKDEPLKEGEDERYNVSPKSDLKESLYNHCIRAIDKGLNFGPHNIPLMGSGDWNDGMSTVGNKGTGESVWLGWFIYAILKDFKDLCAHRNDKVYEDKSISMMKFLRDNLEENAWDGRWYRRAYFDDGTPLGSDENEECKIDALSQCWAVISEAGDADRINVAMDNLEKYLVKEEEKMVLLLTPPFDKSSLEPGYIKGYIPGVRENGGQYTHGVTWVALALAKMGRGDEAYKVFSMLNPINHGLTKEDQDVFMTEPYVMAADVYSVEPHVGRGGWSWYTGSSGWMYTIAVKYILGLQLIEGKGFTIKPCVPITFNKYTIDYKFKNAMYHITVTRGREYGVILDGEAIKGDVIPIMGEGHHEVEVTFK